MLVESARLQEMAVRITPHIVDTVLLISSVALVVMSRQYPTTTPWVTIKIGLLLDYIILGTLALRRGKTRQIRIICFTGALITITAIFSVAILKPAI